MAEFHLKVTITDFARLKKQLPNDGNNSIVLYLCTNSNNSAYKNVTTGNFKLKEIQDLGTINKEGNKMFFWIKEGNDIYAAQELDITSYTKTTNPIPTASITFAKK